MLKLGLAKEPFWLNLPGGAKVRVKPLTMGIYQAARTRAWADAEKASGATRGPDGKLSDDTDNALLNGLFNGYLAQHLARYGIEAWENIGDASGQPVDCTPDLAAELMLIPGAGTSFLSGYTASVQMVVTEGNA